MNSVTAQAAELKRALQQLYKQAENADTKDDTSAKKKPNFSYTSKSKQKPELKAKADEDSSDDDILSGSGWATAGDVLGLSSSDARAGKATTLAKAMGQDPDINLTNPNTMNFVNAGLLGVGGSMLGSYLGGPSGALAGAGAGLLGGKLLGNIERASQISKVRDDYNKARSEGQSMDLSAANPNLSRWGALLPFGGFHRAGSVDALEQLAGKPARNQNNNLGRAGMTGSTLLGHAGHAAGLAGGSISELIGSTVPGAGMGLAALGMIGGGAEGYDAAARNQKLISELEKGGEATDDLEDYDDLTDDVPDEFKGAHGEMRRFISDTNNKKGKKMNEQAMKKSAAFAASLGHYSGTMHKRAIMETLKGFGNNALDYYKGLDPTAQAAILGGGVGAGVGGIGNALFGKRKKGVGILGRLGRGALAGGGIGALGGAGINEAAIRLGMYNNNQDRDSQIYSAGFEGNSMPSQMANEYLGIGN